MRKIYSYTIFQSGACRLSFHTGCETTTALSNKLPVVKSLTNCVNKKKQKLLDLPKPTATYDPINKNPVKITMVAESLGQKKGPPLKAAPSSKTTTAPSTKSDDTAPAAAKGSISVPPKDKAEPATQPPSTTSSSQVQETTQPARAPRAPEVQAPVEKDAAMTYTEQVMQQAASAVPASKLTDEAYETMAQERWQKMLSESGHQYLSQACTSCTSSKGTSR